MVVLSVIVAAAFADVVLSGVLTGSCARVRDGRERRAPAPRRPPRARREAASAASAMRAPRSAVSLLRLLRLLIRAQLIR
jgi:hypothetical protein